MGRRAITASAAALWAVSALPSFAQEHRFDVAALPAADAIIILGRQAGVQIAGARKFTEGRRTKAVRGTMTVDQALAIMFEGTGLQGRKTADRAYLIALAAAPSPVAMGPARRVVPLRPAKASASTRLRNAPMREDDKVIEDIIVTGTLIRGLSAPTGTNLISLDMDTIRSASGTNALDVVNQTIPQLSAFNALQVGNANAGSPVPRIGLRGFGSAGNAAGQSGTLVLFNGHRVVPVGILTTDPDPQLIPSELLETIQVLPDGGSSIYGSDAIGGVVNFVTKRRVDGLQFAISHRFANDYGENSISVIGGTHWSSGSALVSASYARHDAIFGRDRSYITSDFTSRKGRDFRSTSCGYGNFSVDGVSYAAPQLQPTARLDRCDATDNTSLVPRDWRFNLFAFAEQEIAPSVKISIDAFYSIRHTRIFTDTAYIPSSLTITVDNPVFQSVAGETSQTVNFNYSRGIGRSRVSPQSFRQFQIDPSLIWAVDDRWAIRADLLYGRSATAIHDRTGLGSAAVASTGLNPYDMSLSNPDALRAIADFELYSRAVNRITSGQVTAEGHLADLPGGSLGVAVGTEIRRQSLDGATVTGPIGTREGLYRSYAGRTVKAVYGEISLPIVSEGNARPLIQSLSVSTSMRYDHYSDFGSTTNPRIGVDYGPGGDVSLRASYQTTFVAPSLADSGNKLDTRLQLIAVSPGVTRALIAGAGTNLRPQTGRNISLGFDFRPGSLPGLKVALTYWNTRIKNIVSQALSAYTLAGSYSTPFNLCGAGAGNIPASASGACSLALLEALQPAFLRIDNGGAPGIRSLADLFAPGQTLASVVDARRANFGTQKIRGIDFDVAFTMKTGFGAVFGQLAGTYILEKKVAPVPGADYWDYLSGAFVNGQTPRYKVVATAGLTQGPFSGRFTVRRNGGYHIPATLVPGQTHVAGYILFDLHGSYDLGHISILKSLTVDVAVQNLFDRAPPYFGAFPTTGNVAGFANGGTLGRAITLGIRTKI